jgi:repressor LexA
MKNAETMKLILVENLNFYLAKKGLNQTDMARDLNFPETTVSNWMKGETYPRPDRLQMMADYFNVRRSDLTERRVTNIIEIPQRTVRIPVLGEIACGDPILVEENFEDYRTVLEESLPTGDLVYLQAKGDSMHPTIPDGSMVLIRIQEEVENGEIAAVTFNLNAHATLKRVKKQNGLIFLMPDNPAHEPIVITKENPARIIGKAIRSEQEL